VKLEINFIIGLDVAFASLLDTVLAVENLLIKFAAATAEISTIIYPALLGRLPTLKILDLKLSSLLHLDTSNLLAITFLGMTQLIAPLPPKSRELWTSSIEETYNKALMIMSEMFLQPASTTYIDSLRAERVPRKNQWMFSTKVLLPTLLRWLAFVKHSTCIEIPEDTNTLKFIIMA
jgi:hypothetical protein